MNTNRRSVRGDWNTVPAKIFEIKSFETFQVSETWKVCELEKSKTNQPYDKLLSDSGTKHFLSHLQPGQHWFGGKDEMMAAHTQYIDFKGIDHLIIED